MYFTNGSAHTEQTAAIFSRWGSIPLSRMQLLRLRDDLGAFAASSPGGRRTPRRPTR